MRTQSSRKNSKMPAALKFCRALPRKPGCAGWAAQAQLSVKSGQWRLASVRVTCKLDKLLPAGAAMYDCAAAARRLAGRRKARCTGTCTRP